MPKIIGEILHGLSYTMWNPDFVCGLVAACTLEKRVYEEKHYEPGGSVLQLVEENIADDDWLVWVTSEELKSEVKGHDRTELLLAMSSLPARSGEHRDQQRARSLGMITFRTMRTFVDRYAAYVHDLRLAAASLPLSPKFKNLPSRSLGVATQRGC